MVRPLERVERRLFTPMAYTMGYALLGALLTALALVPALAYYAFRKPGRVYHNRCAVAALDAVSDHMLADIGLTRSDVRDAFAEPAWRDPTSLMRDRAFAGRLPKS